MTKKLSKKLLASIILITFVIILIIATLSFFRWFSNSAKNPEVSTTTDTSQVNSNVTESQLINPTDMKAIGDVVQLNNFTMRVNSVESKSTITSQGQVYNAEEGSKYLVISMTLTNTTKEPIFLFGDFGKIILMDDNETTYKPASEEVSFTPESVALLTLNPGVPDTGILTFRLPVGVTYTNVGCISLDGTKFVGTKISW